MMEEERYQQPPQLRDIFTLIDEMEPQLLQDFKAMLRIPAIAPVSGGDGEGKKAKFLLQLLGSMEFDEVRVLEAQDTVPRPNIIAVKHGIDRSQRMWIMCHMDVVPPGDLSKWDTDPFDPIVKEGKIFARGTEDNGQELMASMYALKALQKLGITPAMDIGLLLVSDEETGSEFGIRYLVKEGIFRKDDLIIVPDAGNVDATELEIAEKSILWLKVTTNGIQTHGSTPHRGINAMVAGMMFGSRASRELKSSYSGENPLFNPPISTFEPTKKESNVPNVNTIPGEDIFYMDCRILPGIDPDQVIEHLKSIASEVEQETGATIGLKIVQKEVAAPPTPEDAPVVKLLTNAVKRVWKNEPKAIGIGGGTCAAILRRAGYEAVVWGRIDEVAHGPNEYCRIENVMGDTKVYALLFTGL